MAFMVKILIPFNTLTNLPFQILPIDDMCYCLSEFFVPTISCSFCCLLEGIGAQISCQEISHDTIDCLLHSNLVLQPLLVPYSNCQNQARAIQTQWHFKRSGSRPTNVSYRTYATVRLLVLPGDAQNQKRENFGIGTYLNRCFLQDCFAPRT